MSLFLPFSLNEIDNRELRSPMTGEPMDAVYFPCMSLRNLVHDYMERKRKERKQEKKWGKRRKIGRGGGAPTST